MTSGVVDLRLGPNALLGPITSPVSKGKIMIRLGMALSTCAMLLTIGTSSFAREPGSDTHVVQRGQVLGKIAKRYNVTVADLCKRNGIRRSDVIRPGQRLKIPAAPIPIRPPPPGASWAPYMKPAWKRGYITVAGHGRSWKGYVIGPENQVLPMAQKRVSRVLASWRTGKTIVVEERLVRLIAHVSDVFGGRKIRIVSGYRETSHAPRSRHKTGEAVDFSIPGIPNDVLRDYLRTLPDVGVGYYPNSTHVHLDVRKKNGYWIDYSRPGKGPVYPWDLARGKAKRKSRTGA